MTPVSRILRSGIEVTVKKPNIIINYVKHIGGVDRADQLASTYCFLRKSLKWLSKLFFLGSRNLLNKFTRARASTSTFDSEDIPLNGNLHNILTGVRKDCKVGSKSKNPGKRQQTTYFCDTCPDKLGMNLGYCYMKYHTKLNYKD
ncbi:PREDICTED: uncharacterized protein LOC106791974 [Polistes canadensis]|uniref:uncharacterized protein LOC106791974 n=1 Tax=Polistes canadensis TaxID=91411 RepID=UPI000718FA69|nr:PREDICTED: uncharacterized protein LOC106791974 [Polistes canadensis]